MTALASLGSVGIPTDKASGSDGDPKSLARTFTPSGLNSDFPAKILHLHGTAAVDMSTAAFCTQVAHALTICMRIPSF